MSQLDPLEPTRLELLVMYGVLIAAGAILLASIPAIGWTVETAVAGVRDWWDEFRFRARARRQGRKSRRAARHER